MPATAATATAPADPTNPFVGAVVAMAVLAVLVVRQVGEDGSSGHSSSTAQSPGKYTQTRSKPYAATTCIDWPSSMTDPQKFAASADMLLGARKVDGGAGLPGDALANEFTSGVTTICVTPVMKLTDAAVGLYLIEPRFKPEA